jgi:Ca2+-binding RTX toxin-like protein
VFGGLGGGTVVTGSGNDTIWGNEGDDTIAGGTGADRYVFLAASGNDQIGGFNFADGSAALSGDKTVPKPVLRFRG